MYYASLPRRCARSRRAPVGVTATCTPARNLTTTGKVIRYGTKFPTAGNYDSWGVKLHDCIIHDVTHEHHYKLTKTTAAAAAQISATLAYVILNILIWYYA